MEQTLREILGFPFDSIQRQRYNANAPDKRISEIKIDGNTITGYSAFYFLWEKSYIKSPSRSGNGSISNLNSYSTFITPHLKIDFTMLSIDAYRTIMRLLYAKNEHIVECYDIVNDRTTVNNMYFSTESMPNLYTLTRQLQGEEPIIEVLGVKDYTVELIGTNNDFSLVSVVYHLNPPADTGYADLTIGEEDVYKGQDIVIGSSASSIVAETFGGKYKFTKWNVDGTNPTTSKEQGNFINGQVYTINVGDEIEDNESAFVLYALWEATTDHNLNFNYGLADPSIDESTYTYETSRKVVQGKSIGTLPTAETPTVKAKDLNGNETTYTPYVNGAWYKTPIKTENSVAVKSGDLYWLNRDSTIYLLYDTTQYVLNLYIDGSLHQTNYVAYNSTMNLPLLVKSGYTFDGWYYTSDFQSSTKFSGSMPPYSLTLYARWVKQ